MEPVSSITSGIDSAAALLGPAAFSGPTPDKPAEAAQQFESILIAQMLQSARESAASLGGDDEDSLESGAMLDIAGQQFAQMIAKNGGFGIARIVNAGLASSSAKP